MEDGIYQKLKIDNLADNLAYLQRSIEAIILNFMDPIFYLQINEEFMIKACYMYMNSKIKVPIRAEAIVTRSELGGCAGYSLPDGRIKVHRLLYKVLRHTSFPGKFKLLICNQNSSKCFQTSSVM